VSNPDSKITYWRVLWTSTWPLLVVTILVGVATDTRPNAGAASIWGSVFAWLFVKDPVFTFRAAFVKAVKVALPVQFALNMFLYALLSRYVQASIAGTLVEAVVGALLWSAVWAFFIVRKARKLDGPREESSPPLAAPARDAVDEVMAMAKAAPFPRRDGGEA
jgi:hypothetical protein